MKDLENHLNELKSRLERYLEHIDFEKGRSKSFWNGMITELNRNIEELEPIVNELTRKEL